MIELIVVIIVASTSPRYLDTMICEAENTKAMATMYASPASNCNAISWLISPLTNITATPVKLRNMANHCMSLIRLSKKNIAMIAVIAGLVAIMRDPLTALVVVNPLLKKYIVRNTPNKDVKNIYQYAFDVNRNKENFWPN